MRHVINPTTGKWIAVNDLSQVIPRARPLSRRLLNSDLQRLHSVLVRMFPSFFNSKGFLHAPALLLRICHQPDLPLNIKISSNIKGLSAPSKLIYAIINSTLNHLPEYIITFWHLQGFLDEDNEIQWKQIYELPTRKKQGDMQFKLLHNVIPSLPVLQHLNPDISSCCGWCGERGTIWHMFITCSSIQPTLNLLHRLICLLLPDLQLNFNIYWALIPHARRRSKEAVRLANFLIVSCKYVIHTLYRTSRYTDPLIIWRFQLQYRILLEYHFYKSSHNTVTFKNKWSINNALFTVVNGEFTWLF